MNILHIDSSPRGERSASRKLAAELVELLLQAQPDMSVVYRDVSRDPVPHVTGAWIEGAYIEPEERSPAAAEAMAVSDGLVDELLAADIILISAPMYNFSVPSTLKAWIDQIVRVGRTFSPDMKGLVHGKKAIVITSRSADYSPGTPIAQHDHQAPLFRTVFGFIGVTDLTFVHIQGMSSKSDRAAAALDAARAQLPGIVAGI